MSLLPSLRSVTLRLPKSSSNFQIQFTTAANTSAFNPPPSFCSSSSSFSFSRSTTILFTRYASTSSRGPKSTTSKRSPSKLAKPDRFRPPSHPSGRAAALAAAARRRQRNPFADGPPLSEAQRTAQRVKRYPNTFPQKGTVSRKVLTNRSLHMWFALTFLTSITLFLIISDFLTTTSPEIYILIPPISSLFTNPLNFLSTYWHLFGLHLEYTSALAQEQRQRKNDDVQKRREFRIAHGLEEDLPTPALPGTVVAGGVGKSANEEMMALAEAARSRKEREGMRAVSESDEEGTNGPRSSSKDVYVDFEGKTQSTKKKWYDFLS